jgi:hypothetical protein
MGCIAVIGKLIGMLILAFLLLLVIVGLMEGDYILAIISPVAMIPVWFFMNIGETRRRMKNRRIRADFNNSFTVSGVKKIKITRKRTILNARWIPYHCIIGYELEDFRNYLNLQDYALSEDAMKNINYNPLSLETYKNMPRAFNPENFKAYLDIFNLAETVKIVPIESSEVKIVDLGTQRTTIFVAKFGSAGVGLGNQITIGEGSGKKSFIIETNSSLKKGSVATIREES